MPHPFLVLQYDTLWRMCTAITQNPSFMTYTAKRTSSAFDRASTPRTVALLHQLNSCGWEISLRDRKTSLKSHVNQHESFFKNNNASHRMELTPFCCSPKDDVGTHVVSSGKPLVSSETNVTGTWVKDRSKSSSMDDACDAVELPFIYRKAIPFLNRLVLVDDEQHFRTVLKAGGLLDVEEEYPWTGDEVAHHRRDKRRGKHTGRVCRTDSGFPRIMVRWSDPYGGTCTDTFELVKGSGGMEMKQSTMMVVRGKNIEYFTYYRRIQ